MNAIILQFVAGPGWESGAIEWFSQGVVSHVDCVLDNGNLLGARSDVVDGVPAGVQIRPGSYVNGEQTVRAVLPAPSEMINRFYELCRAEVGKPYDSSGLIANFVFGRNWREADSWWCSELQGAMLERCGWFSSPLATPTNKLTPAGLLLACSARVPVEMP